MAGDSKLVVLIFAFNKSEFTIVYFVTCLTPDQQLLPLTDGTAVVVAQAVEQWHSVQAGRVQFLGLTCLAFFGSELLLIYSGWALGFL